LEPGYLCCNAAQGTDL